MSASLEVWLHDTRAEGTIPPAAGRTVVRIDETTPVLEAASKVVMASRAAGGASVLWIVCHGPTLGVSRAEDQGGWPDAHFGGLPQLGKDGVSSRNVSVFGGILKGVISESINILACGPAARWNGMELCRRLAFHSETLVIASQDTQEYTLDRETGNLNVGPWEGRVFRFLPSGSEVAWFVGQTAEGAEAPTHSANPRRVTP